MKRRNNVIAWLTLLILLNIASSGVIYWQQARKVNALSVYVQSIEVEKYLLECRRQEKNFFIRSSMDAFQMYTANHDSATMLISDLMNRKLPIDIRMGCSALSELMEEYMGAFRATSIYRRDNPIGDEMISMMHMCTEAARKCHEQTAAIVAATDRHSRAVHKTTGMATVILMIVAPILSIIIVVPIYREVVLIRLHTPAG